LVLALNLLEFDMRVVFLVISLLLSTNSIGQDIRYDVPLCARDAAGKIPANPGAISDIDGEGNPFTGCVIPAEQHQIVLYKIGLCTSPPTFNYITPQSFEMCTVIFDDANGTPVTVSRNTGPKIPNLNRPANGNYSHFVFVMSNTISIKSYAEFATTRQHADGSSGTFCYSTGQLPFGSTCSNNPSKPGYDFDEFEIQTVDEAQGNLETTPFNGNTQEYFTDSSFRRASCAEDGNGNLLEPGNCQNGPATRWVNIFYPNSPVVINDLTRAIRIGINISAGSDLQFVSRNPPDSPENLEIQSINDAPFAYSVEAIQ
jgi:hypothetical protein